MSAGDERPLGGGLGVECVPSSGRRIGVTVVRDLPVGTAPQGFGDNGHAGRSPHAGGSGRDGKARMARRGGDGDAGCDLRTGLKPGRLVVQACHGLANGGEGGFDDLVRRPHLIASLIQKYPSAAGAKMVAFGNAGPPACVRKPSI